MYINYEKIGVFLKSIFPSQSSKIEKFCSDKKIEQNCNYIQKNSVKVLKRLRNKFGKQPIRVAFWCDDIAKWKCQTLFDLFLESENFEPFILATKNCASSATLNPMSKVNVEKTYEYFNNKKMPVFYAYDIFNEKFIPICHFKPDIIFYQEPWYIPTNQGPVVASKFALTYYVPYFVANLDSEIECNLRFHQYLYKHYVLNKTIYDFYAPKMRNGGKNLCIKGHPQLDFYYLTDHQERGKKYVIYAPHWSIADKHCSYATFQWNGKFILEYAQKHPEINWVFKPHPNLKTSLVRQNLMNGEEVDIYWKEWESIGIVCETSDYNDIFAQSVAMITDCGSFLTEFLLTEQPVIHLVSETASAYNDSVNKIVKTYYQVHNLVELETILDSVIVQKNDYKKQERLDIVAELGLKNNYASKNIIDDIEGELNA